MTAAHRNLIASPATGLLVYQTDEPSGFYFYNGTAWTSLNGTNGQGVPTGGTAGQVLSKTDGTDYNTQWVTLASGGGASEIEKITEGNKTGYRILGRDPARYGDIGINAVDLSVSNGTSTSRGATGTMSFATGDNTTASGEKSVSMGWSNVASGDASSALGRNNSSTASNTFSAGLANFAGLNSAVTLGSYNASTGYSSVAMGTSIYAKAYGEVAVGHFNEDYTPVSTTSRDVNDRAFSVGIGYQYYVLDLNDNVDVRRNGLTVYNSGNTDIGGQIKLNANTAANTYTLPSDRGTANQVLTTDGAGATSWVTPASTPGYIFLNKTADYTITSIDITNNVIISFEGFPPGTNTFTLPPAATAGAGKQISITEVNGSLLAKATCSSGDSFSGLYSATYLNNGSSVVPFRYITLISDGVSKWYCTSASF